VKRRERGQGWVNGKGAWVREDLVCRRGGESYCYCCSVFCSLRGGMSGRKHNTSVEGPQGKGAFVAYAGVVYCGIPRANRWSCITRRGKVHGEH